MPDRSYVNLMSWPGKAGFSQAVVVPPGGRTVHLSGASAKGIDGVTEQCRAIWSTIRKILADAGGGVEHITRLRTYVTDAAYLADVREARLEALGDPPYPAHSFLVVKALAVPSLLVEIEADAVIPEPNVPTGAQ